MIPTNIDVRLVALEYSSIVSGSQPIVAECSEDGVSAIGLGR